MDWREIEGRMRKRRWKSLYFRYKLTDGSILTEGKISSIEVTNGVVTIRLKGKPGPIMAKAAWTLTENPDKSVSFEIEAVGRGIITTKKPQA